MHLQSVPIVALLLTGVAYAVGPHAFTGTSTEAPFVLSPEGGSWAPDGVAFHAYASKTTGADPKYTADPELVQLAERVDQSSDEHFYSIDEAELAALDAGPHQCHLEGCDGFQGFSSGVEIWVYGAAGPGRIPLHRFYNGQFHFYSTSKDEGLGLGYRYEWVAGWVLSNPSRYSTTFYRWRKV